MNRYKNSDIVEEILLINQMDMIIYILRLKYLKAYISYRSSEKKLEYPNELYEKQL